MSNRTLLDMHPLWIISEYIVDTFTSCFLIFKYLPFFYGTTNDTVTNLCTIGNDVTLNNLNEAFINNSKLFLKCLQHMESDKYFPIMKPYIEHTLNNLN